jgi:hypothetical protein
MPPKTEIYTWRLARTTKVLLEDTARLRGQSVAELLDALVTSELQPGARDAETERERQRRLHEHAARFLGALRGGDSRRSERARELVRERLRKRGGRDR